jgi:osmoprotectant transport system ATP-binding protein
MTLAAVDARGYKSVVAAVSAAQSRPSMLAGDTPASTEYRESPMSALVKLVDVSKRYAEATASHSTNLSVERGKTTVLIGPSGCGKSTLLRLIIRLIEPDSGSIEFNGEAITSDTIGKLRRRIGYVIQEGGLFPHLTARANVLLMARHIGKSEDEMQNRLVELCELTRFSVNLLSRYPVELSGGQRQRVGLMRALMLSPELLLLDEPLGALDPLVRASLQKDLKEIFARLQQTVLFVTHDLAEAIYFGDEIVLMKEGRIVQRGSATVLREEPADPFVSEFINAQRGVTLT